MNDKTYISKSKEFDRQIKEAKQAASYALTLDEKLGLIKRVRELEEQKRQFRKEYILKNFEEQNS